MNIFLLHSGKEAVKHLLKSIEIHHGVERPKGMTAGDVMIQWNAEDQDEGCTKMNSTASLMRVKDKKQMARILKLHGMQVRDQSRNSKEFATQSFIVPIFHLEALTVYQRNIGLNSKYQEIDLSIQNRSIERIIREAIKAVYCLGLDFASVHIELQSSTKKRFIICDVDPAPELSPALGRLFAQAINQFSNKLNEESDQNGHVLIGMDPEFVLCKPNGKVAPAGQFLQRQGRAGCDAIVLKGRVVYPLVELRPKPSNEPRQLMMNLVQTMRLAARKINHPELSWIAGGMPIKGLPLGGHLHMSQIWLTSRLLRVLDNYLALPLILIEAQNTKLRRPRYGFLGDFRRKTHGGFEYRTLPSWIVSPRITKGVIALARIIADHYRELNLRPLDNEYIQLCYCQGIKEALIDVVHKIWEDLESLKSYDKYRDYLDPLKLQILSLEPWDEAKDFRRAWRIPPYHI